jgi:hypothetical protein
MEMVVFMNRYIRFDMCVIFMINYFFSDNRCSD